MVADKADTAAVDRVGVSVGGKAGVLAEDLEVVMVHKAEVEATTPAGSTQTTLQDPHLALIHSKLRLHVNNYRTISLTWFLCDSLDVLVLVTIRLWQWFSSVDADRSGAITAEELQQCLINGDWSREYIICLQRYRRDTDVAALLLMMQHSTSIP